MYTENRNDPRVSNRASSVARFTEKKSDSDTVCRPASVTRPRRETLLGHRGVVVWFSGLPAAGKSTLAHAVEEELHSGGYLTFVYDGDDVRSGLCRDLGFSLTDRKENLRRTAEACRFMKNAGIITFAALISPMREDRRRAKALIGADNFIEIYCKCPLEVCEQRDIKGMYKKARAGLIPEYTGISSPYEEPENADIIVNTGFDSLETCVNQVLDYLSARGILSKG